MVSLSVIIPAYNEARRIPPYLQSAIAYLNGRGLSFEILVVDDGSTDETAALIGRMATQNPGLRLLRLPHNSGKGAAVRAGMQAAQGKLQLFADADGATPIQELERLEVAMNNGADLAIGSRTLASRDRHYRVQARLHRTVLGNLFNRIVRLLGIRDINDTQCGFKLFRQSVAQDLFSVGRIDGYGFDLELLYIAQQRGYRIAEVPINWTDQPGSKVRVLRDGLAMVREMLAVRRNNARGLYAARQRFPVSG
ncbi:MAG: glycosyltransferase family 2 protein [Nitrospiraceae bacterium]|nr:glycosyltransferase family 2 protein [Nitrospiraceae bacterium]MSR23854.1 glycosyltransferase family 2 protein [Nitrospiraceae bacterium]